MADDKPTILVRRRGTIALLLLLLTLPAAWVCARHLKVDNALAGWFAEEDPAFSRYETFTETFGQESFFTVSFASKDVFSRQSLALVHALTQDLGSIPLVRRVDSLTTVPIPKLRRKSIRLEPMIGDPSSRTAGELRRARELILNHPIHAGTVVDRYGTTAVVIGKVDALSVVEKHELRQALTPIIDRHERASGLRLHLAGAPILDGELDRVSRADMSLFVPLLTGVLGLALWLVFRSVAVVFAALFGVGFSLVATFAILAGFGYPVTVVTGLLPALFLTIGVAATGHVMLRYRQFRRETSSRDRALEKALKVALKPAVLSALTTAAGFASLIPSGILPARIVGMFAGVGILLACLAPVALLPFFIHLFEPPRASRSKHLSLLQKGLAAIGRGAVANRRPILLASTLILLVAGLGMARLRTEVDVLRFLHTDNRVREDYEFTEARLGGISPVELVIQGAQPGAMASPERIDQIETIETYARQMGEEVHTTSIAGILEAVELAWRSFERDRLELDLPVSGQIVRVAVDLSPTDPDPFSLEELLNEKNLTDPEEQGRILKRLAAVLEDLKKVRAGPVFGEEDPKKRLDLVLNILEKKELARPYLTADRSRTRITVVARSWSTPEGRSQIRDLERFAQQVVGPEATVEVTGLVSLYQELDQALIRSQKRSALFGVLFIALVILCGIRSLRQTLLLMVPNLAPLVLTLGLMGWLGLPLNMATLLIVGVAIGIAVDDTLHYAFGFREARGTVEERVQAAHRRIGPSMLFTTIVLMVGFGALTASEFRPTVIFGLLTALTMAFALVADLLLLPALLKVGRVGSNLNDETSEINESNQSPSESTNRTETTRS